jgi:hypothetical protein
MSQYGKRHSRFLASHAKNGVLHFVFESANAHSGFTPSVSIFDCLEEGDIALGV